jgi:hypothetical protein
MDIVHLVLFVATWLLPHRGIALLVVLFESDERWTARLLGKVRAHEGGRIHLRGTV